MAVQAYLLFKPKVASLLLRKEKHPIVRGKELAAKLGCFSCHGDGGRGGVPNPGSETGEIPSFIEQEPMMWVEEDLDQELKEYILYGHPKRLQKPEKSARLPFVTPAFAHKGESHPKAPDAQEKAQPRMPQPESAEEEGLIKMPAFEKVVSQRDLEDLVLFIKANAYLIAPDPKLAQGEELTIANGCFACHGPLGAGGVSNPGSFKGYIPGFMGEDFEELVRSRKELLAWIEQGITPRFKKSRMAMMFTERQRIKMPAFGEVLSEEEIAKVADYVEWLHKIGERLAER